MPAPGIEHHGSTRPVGYPSTYGGGGPATVPQLRPFDSYSSDPGPHTGSPRTQYRTSTADRFPEYPHPDWEGSVGSSHRISPEMVYSSEHGLKTTTASTTPGMKGFVGGAGSTATSSGTRRPSNRDEFDGPHQLLDKPGPDIMSIMDRELPIQPTHLAVQEQDGILAQVNDHLSQCAFHFVARYQFPIPLEADKRPVRVPSDREWTEWVFLLKRLATKRRIPARLLYQGQIKQLITVLENSLEMRHAAKHQSRPIKDDRNVLQLVAAGIQVAKILKDGGAMEALDRLYVHTEQLVQERKAAGQGVMYRE
ncbi:MAG: hypothetical protein M1823_003557 [Watsoniomyces obsoletus]|nr:MAG: hypothetical protein M1823_003557 [Watsoniomyces obsoletus]